MKSSSPAAVEIFHGHRAWRWNNGVPGWKCQRVGPYKAEKNYETYDVGVAYNLCDPAL